MIHIWIIDDNPRDLERLERILTNYFFEISINISIETFSNAKNLPDAYPDLVFMDVELEEASGLELAKGLKERNPHVQIVLVSAFAGHSIAGYQTGASRFLVKPVDILQVRLLLDTGFVKQLSLEQSFTDPSLSLKPLAFSSIVYVEAYDGASRVCFKNGLLKKSGRPLKEWSSLLPGQSFVQCHKSIFINMHYIDRLDGSSKTLSVSWPNGKTCLPVSRRLFKKVSEAYQEFVCSSL